MAGSALAIESAAISDDSCMVGDVLDNNDDDDDVRGSKLSCVWCMLGWLPTLKTESLP